MMVLIIVLALALTVLATDSRLKTVHYEIENPYSEEPLRIAFITDLHSCAYGGESQTGLVEAVRAQNPDIVLFGGDIFDGGRMSEENAVSVLEALGSEFRCFFVSGNHEVKRGKLDYYKKIVRSCNVKVLEGEGAQILNSDLSTKLYIYGFNDVSAYDDFNEQLAHIEKTAENPNFENSFNVLLIHRPEEIESFAEFGFDLVLSGHAHGGQWRIPGILNGLYTPSQGLFPKYAGGFYKVGETSLIVSRGLAKESNFVPRIFNRPELVIIDIV